jgi:acetyltransferase-like isoleucine patch superfamily enzyme
MIKNIKKIIKNFIYRPFNLKNLGKDSIIYFPRKITNKDRIFIGDRFRMGKMGLITPVIKYGSQFFSPNIMIGDDVYFGGFAQIHCAEEIKIDNGCVFSEYVYISDITHGFDPDAGLIIKQNLATKKIHIGAHTFVGYGSSILPGVNLGEHCIVGTNSVVTKSFPAYSMLAGSPAKIIKKYNHISKAWEKTNDEGVFFNDI